MNALLQTRFNQIFASLSGRITDPTLSEDGGLIGSDITAREEDFGLSLQNYQSNFALAPSANMSPVRSSLLNDARATGPGIISDQQQSLDGVVNNSWPAYLSLQKQETTILDSLDPTLHNNLVALTDAQLAANYIQAYPILCNANLRFTDLQNALQRVVTDPFSMGKTVTAVGPSETQPVLIAALIAVLSTLLIVVGTVWRW